MKLEEKLGCGDGVNTCNDSKRGTPSSRRFSTKTLPNPTCKAKLQAAIQEVSRSAFTVSRRKSLSLAEITPTRGNTRNRKVTTMSDTNAAARRIFKVLLLNAWRKTTKERELRTEDLRALQDQNKELELQVDALHHLRKSESQKRNEAVAQAQVLHRKHEDSLIENKKLLKSKSIAERDLSVLQNKSYALHVELESTTNDLRLRQNEQQKIEHCVSVEKKKIKRLRLVKRTLIEQEFNLKQEIDHYNLKTADLRETLLNAELLMHDAVFCRDNYEQMRNKLAELVHVVFWLKKMIKNVSVAEIWSWSSSEISKQEKKIIS
uniref:Uncharacterized protein n=1 Tax=Photinus pyralis TaxID=7054 RepID=A0A1Y1NEI2_PHOPY